MIINKRDKLMHHTCRGDLRASVEDGEEKGGRVCSFKCPQIQHSCQGFLIQILMQMPCFSQITASETLSLANCLLIIQTTSNFPPLLGSWICLVITVTPLATLPPFIASFLQCGTDHQLHHALLQS